MSLLARLTSAQIGLLLINLPCFGQGAGSATPKSAVLFLQDYVAFYRNEVSPVKLAEKLAGAWDLEHVARSTFGSDLPDNDVQRKTIQDKIALLFKASLATEQAAKVMKQVKASEFCCVMLDGKYAVVSFSAATENKAITNMFVLHHTEKGWRIVDAANSTSTNTHGLVHAMKSGYQKLRGQMTPERFLDEVLKALVHSAKK